MVYTKLVGGGRLARYKKKQGKGNFSKGVIVCMLLFLFFYTLANLFIFYKTGAEPSTLTVAIVGFCSAEGGYLAFVKKLKNKEEEKEDGI